MYLRRYPLTSLLIAACCLVFLIDLFVSPKGTPFSFVDRALVFDSPRVYDLIDQLFAQFTPEQIEHPENGPLALRQLIIQINAFPVWQGIYPWLATGKLTHAPLFTSILSGEFWRLVTPILLHQGLLHLVFNLMWLLILGPVIERWLGFFRMLLFIIATASFSNTAQYLMTGPNFMGISGLVCAFVGYIWVLKRRHPLLFPTIPLVTLNFLLIFIFGAAALQGLFLFLERAHLIDWTLGIANTAHITGALSGALLATWDCKNK